MKHALVIIDYQMDFVNGSLGFPGGAALEPILIEKIEACLREGGDLLFTLDTHGEDYLATAEGKMLPIVHCVKGTEGHKLYGRVAAYAERSVKIIEKPTFGSLELASYLQEGGYKTVELAGLVSNICVLTNAAIIKTYLPEAQVVVDGEACACADPTMHRAALAMLQSIQVTVR